MVFFLLPIALFFIPGSFLFHSLNPTLVSEAIPGMNPTSLLFAMKTDCVLVGDSEGQVSVYMLKNFTAGEATEVSFNKSKCSSCAS